MLEKTRISQPSSTKTMLDLHGLRVKDAKKLIEAYFAKIEQLNLGEIYIITGRGNHVNSDGSRGVLKKILPKLVKPYCQSIVQINEETGAYKLILKPQQALSDLKNVLTRMFVEEEAQIEYAQFLKQQAEANDVEAMLALAMIHLHKVMQGFDDPDEGLALLLKAKELGSMDAEVHLGTLYHEGILVRQDHEKAFKHFRHAANVGHPVAQYYMGVCYLHGKGVKYNDEQAVHWMKKSADNGDIHAEDSLGDFYLVGKITRQNKKLGIYYKTKAAERGLADAQIDLARCYATGYGVKQNYQTAFKWYQSAAQSDKPYAVYQVGAYLLSGRSGFASNPTEAFAWFLKAAELGDGDGQAEVARQYLFAEEGIAQNLTEGLAWAKKAVDKKNKYGYYVLANAYLRGIGVEQDPLKAYDLMKLSAEANHVEAQYALGLLLTGSTPSDIPQNSESGLQWLKKAAAQDHPEASDALSKLKSKAAVAKTGLLDAYKMLGDSANLFVGERKEKQEKKKPLTQNSIDSNSKKLNKILHFFKDIQEENLPTPEVALRRAAGGLRPENAIGMGDQKTLIQYLLTQVSDMNAASPTTGSTALHNAVIKNQIENVSLLLSAGANDAIKDQKGKTAKDYALEYSNEEMKKLFHSKSRDEINTNSSANVKIPEISTPLDEEIKSNTEQAMGDATLSGSFPPTFFAMGSEEVSTATASNADIAESTSNICNM